MDGSIAQLACHYHVYGSGAAAQTVAHRFDRLARTRLPAMLAEALDQALAGDRTVYVVRRVAARAGLRVRASHTDEQVARRWSDTLAAAVMRMIAGDTGDGNVIRFADRADYVAHFIGDLLHGRAWGCWYYRSFSAYRSPRTPETLLAVLHASRPELPEILGRLHRAGALAQLVAAIDEADARQLWDGALDGARGVSPEALRPLFAAAIGLADRLELWADSRPAAEPLFRALLASRPTPVDWRDRRGLAAALLAILRFLAGHQHLRLPGAAGRDALLGRLDQAVAGLDWLDAAWLGAALAQWAAGGQRAPEPDAPGQPQPGRAARADERAAWPQLLMAALSLIDQLAIWAGPRPALEPLLQAFLAASPAPTDPPQGRARTAALQALVDFLDERHALRPRSAAERASLLARLDTAAAGGPGAAHPWRWAPAPPDAAHSAPGAADDLPARPASAGPTPRQRDLLADLAHIIPAVRLSGAAPASAGNALKLYAALIDHAPRWAGDPLATGVIQRTLEAWDQVERSGSLHMALQQLAFADAPHTPAVRGPSDALRFLAGLGEPGQALIEQLRRYTSAAPAPSSRPPARPRLRSAPVTAETGCAGVFFLLRAAIDTRLPALLDSPRREPGADAEPLAALLAAVGLRWAGPPGLAGGQLDPGLALLAGLDHAPEAGPLRHVLAAIDYDRLQRRLLDTLAGLRMLRGVDVARCEVRLPDGTSALVSGSAARQLWPLGRRLAPGQAPAGLCAGWPAAWEDATGQRPDFAGPAGDHGGEALDRMLSALWADWPDLPAADLSITLVAGALLRVWARWLRGGFDASSAPYLLENIIRRPGSVTADEASITIEMQRRALDVVVETSGYLADIETVPWLGQRRVRFRIQR